MKPILALLAAFFALAACQTPSQSSQAAQADPPSPVGITGRLLESGRLLPQARLHVVSANRPERTITATTDAGGRFHLSPDDTGPASPGGDILRIEVTGRDYRATGEVSPASLEVTCDLGASTGGSEIQMNPATESRRMKCW